MADYRNKKHLVFDFEAIGQDSSKCPAVNLSFGTFTFQEFEEEKFTFEKILSRIKHIKLSIADQVTNHGASYKKADLDWWFSQSKEVQQQLLPTDDDHTVDEFITKFIFQLKEEKKIDYWWSRSNTYDPIILTRLFKALNKDALLNEYLPYWKVRDIRTWIDAKFDFTVNNGFNPTGDDVYWNSVFKQHDSRHDVAADILRFQTIYRAERCLDE